MFSIPASFDAFVQRLAVEMCFLKQGGSIQLNISEN